MTTFTTLAPITATCTTAGAQLRITATDRTDTVVTVDGAHVDVEFADGQLSIKKSRPGDPAVVTVALPTGSNLVLNTAKTDVHAEGSFGACTLGLTSGTARLDQVGTLRGHFADSEIQVGTASSDVDLSGSGGSLTVAHAEAAVTVKAADCPIRIDKLSGGHADLTNAAGGIEVGIADGVVAEVDAKSTKGTVRNSVPGGTGATVKVHARTRRDDITIKPAR